MEKKWLELKIKGVETKIGESSIFLKKKKKRGNASLSTEMYKIPRGLD